MYCDERRIERAGEAAERRADRESHQGVAAGVDAERQRPHRIFAQRHEGAAPGRADQPDIASVTMAEHEPRQK